MVNTDSLNTSDTNEWQKNFIDKYAIAQSGYKHRNTMKLHPYLRNKYEASQNSGHRLGAIADWICRLGFPTLLQRCLVPSALCCLERCINSATF